MSKSNNKTRDIEMVLETYYQLPDPSPNFLNALEVQLKEASQGRRGTAPKTAPESLFDRIFGKRWPRRAFVPAMIALTLVFAVVLIGPQQVLAQVQSWLGYVPGYGFVDLDSARALGQPVSQTKDGVTVTVKQVLSNQDGTFVVLSADGLPPEEEILLDLRPAAGENHEEWLARNNELWETDARLIMPDGSVLDQQYFQGAPWDGFFTYATLPKDVLEVTLEFSHIPGIAAGKAPEGWRFELALEYTNAPQTLALPEARWVDQVSESIHGIALRILDVVYAGTEVSVRVQLENLPEGWTSPSRTLEGKLTDDAGNEYPIIYGPNSGVDPDGVYTLTFVAVSSEAKQLAFTASEIFLSVPLADQSIRVDFGDAPQIGDRIPIDETVDVLGISVRFAAVSILDGKVAYMPEETVLTTLNFDIDRTPIQNGIGVTGLGYFPDVSAMFGSRYQGVTGMSGGGADPEAPGYTQVGLSMSIPADLPLPTGSYELPLGEAQVLLEGPYTITWEIE